MKILTTLPGAPATLVLPLLLAGCDVTQPGDPLTTRITVEVGLPESTTGLTGLAGMAWLQDVPESVASVSLEVASPGCADPVAYQDVQNMTGDEDAVAFSLDLEGASTACFTVRAHSAVDAGGTVVFEGSTAGVDLSGGGHISVRVDLGFVETVPPVVATLAATDVGSATATFQATVAPSGFETVAYFEWGVTTAYGSATPVQQVGGGRDAVAVSQLVTGLQPEQSYHYRVVAINSGNIVHGLDQSFTTPPADFGVDVAFPEVPPPVVVTDPAGSVTGVTAQLNATVDPEGTDAWMYFEYGVDGTYGSTTPVQGLGGGTEPLLRNAVVTGLVPGTTYNFRAVAFNAGGLSLGADQAFLTTGCTPVGFDVPDNGFDEDCDGTADNVETCDAELVLASLDPLHAASALGLCRTVAHESDWGLVSARWVLPDGTSGVEAVDNFHIGHGLSAFFGSVATPQEGHRLLVLSSGAARAPSQPGYVVPDPGYTKGYSTGYPEGAPATMVGCPDQGTPHDGAGLEVTLRVPDNATGLSFRFKYHTADYPAWTCTAYTDQFLVMMTPFLGGEAPGNIAFDALGNPVSANSTGSLGAPSSHLVGTGYEDHAASDWLTSAAPVDGGALVTIRFLIYDSQDGQSDSLVLLDDFRWMAD